MNVAAKKQPAYSNMTNSQHLTDSRDYLQLILLNPPTTHSVPQGGTRLADAELLIAIASEGKIFF